MTSTDQTTRSPDVPRPLDVREAALRPFSRPGWRFWMLAAALTAVVAVGVSAWIVQLRDGLHAAGYNDEAFWAVDIADVVTFIGVSYGGAVISAILRLTGAHWRAPLTRLAEGTAVVTVLIGAALIIPHLGRPDRLWELLTRPNMSSPVFWDFVAVTTYAVASIVFFALPLVPDMAIARQGHGERLGHRTRLYAAVSRGWTASPRQRRVLSGALGVVSIVIIPLAVSVHSVLSWAFALVSRPWWHESIWAPYFVVAALYSGVALVILVVAGFRRAYHLQALITERHFIRLGFILAAFAAAYLYLAFADILPGAYVGEPDTAAVFHTLLVGRFAPWFWIFVVGGGLIPLLLVALPHTRNTRGMVTAAALVVPAMWLKRVLMVTAPANYDRVTGAFGAYHFTWISVSITLAGLAAIPLLLMILFRVVPLLSIDEIEQADASRTESFEPATESFEPATESFEPATGSAERGRTQSGPSAGASPTPSDTPATPERRRASRWFRDTGVILLLLIGAGLLATHTAPPVRAATPKPRAATIAITATETTGTLHLAALLTSPGRRPLADAAVSFFQLSTEFGPQGHLVPLGSASTGTNGTAQFSYRPTANGSQQFTAKYAGTPNAGPSTATTTITITAAHSAYQPAPRKPLAGLGKVTANTLLAIVAAIWLILIAQIARVRRVCRGGGSDSTAPGQ